jgi:predicted alpha/beta superfamily hydrolase
LAERGTIRLKMLAPVMMTIGAREKDQDSQKVMREDMKKVET